ncbi:hypothetical protein V2J09_016714, partial [Rumex salicifolius]
PLEAAVLDPPACTLSQLTARRLEPSQHTPPPSHLEQPLQARARFALRSASHLLARLIELGFGEEINEIGDWR